LNRRSEFDAITRALQLAEVSLPADGRIRAGTLVARSGTAARGAETPESRQQLLRPPQEDARSLPRFEVSANGAPLLVMKKIQGATLEELMHQAAHPEWPALLLRHGDRIAVFVEVLMRVAEALHFAHTKAIFHRDIKPANVMVGSFGEVYLLDWGVALRGSEAKDAPIEIVGTPQYMAPEMVRAEAEAIDARTDVYLLGATLHALLTGTPRHTGDGLPLLLFAASRAPRSRTLTRSPRSWRSSRTPAPTSSPTRDPRARWRYAMRWPRSCVIEALRAWRRTPRRACSRCGAKT